MYVEYLNGEREYYDLESDPYELTNIYPELSPEKVDALHSRLVRMESCHGTPSCRRAARSLP
jgi:N-acetylglucosamine-6-sulfatase